MEIKAAIKDGIIKFEISPSDLLHDIMTGEQRLELIESLSCHDEIINHVADQIISGYTENGFSGSWCASRTTALQKARKALAENSAYAVRRTIADLENEIKSLKDTIERFRDKSYR